jgi:transcriptional regulator PpsR
MSLSAPVQPTLRSLSASPVAAQVVAAASDLTLVIDSAGVVEEVALGPAVEANQAWDKLVGRRWVETALRDSQAKVDELLADARAGKPGRWREVNLRVEGLGDVTFRFSAVALGESAGRVIVLGRDLRPIAALQQRMVSSQQAMDRDMARLREADTRYRLLFHLSSEGVVIVDAASRKVLEVNPAASTLLGEPAASVQGKPVHELFEPRSRTPVQTMLGAVDAGARPNDIDVTLRTVKKGVVRLSAFLFRQAGSALMLLRFSARSGVEASAGSVRSSRMMAALEAMPDGFVVAGEDRRILHATIAFCELVQQASENQVIGEPLDRWVGRTGVDVNIMVANLREHGSIKNFATIIRGDYGAPHEGLVTAVSALDGKVPCFGFTIRTVSSRLAAVSTTTLMPRSMDQLHELVGRVPLKDLVREAGDMIERMCIVAALEVSGNNRASAAQLLGLSRQGLYTKLRRYKIAEFGAAS